MKNVYFGDLHVHTSYSFDAYDYGTRSDPSMAYAFARGAKIDVVPTPDSAHGQTQGPLGVKIDVAGQKLDFMAVTDHAEFLGSMRGCVRNDKSGFYDRPYCRALRGPPSPDFNDMGAPNYVVTSPCLGTLPNGGSAESCTQETELAWQEEQSATRAAYERCKFTTLHGFEWSGVDLDTEPRATLHRNVIFANDNVPQLPIDFVTHRSVTKLWSALEAECNAANSCEAITIPHNSNQSQGRMFDMSNFTDEDVMRMERYQTLVEIHQSKGNSECLTDTADTGEIEVCGFEPETGDGDPAYAPGYVRPALEQGLAYFRAHGLDPLELGFVGSTDTHDATPGNVVESSWPGHYGVLDNTPLLRLTEIAGQNPGGLTGVWAEENTREAIWAALRRREVFATSGPRIKVRFYAHHSASDPCADPAFPERLVRDGAIPMGGTLSSSAAPSFVVYALSDATPLAEVDFVKGGIAATSTKTIERIHTVKASGPPYCVSWTDAAFDPASAAFYYARIREQPTPRWSHYDCERLKQSNPSDWQERVPGCRPGSEAGLDVMIQERAWTSPIWYLHEARSS
jgi:uncharacterized protein DUF3604